MLHLSPRLIFYIMFANLQPTLLFTMIDKARFTVKNVAWFGCHQGYSKFSRLKANATHYVTLKPATSSQGMTTCHCHRKAMANHSGGHPASLTCATRQKVHKTIHSGFSPIDLESAHYGLHSNVCITELNAASVYLIHPT